MNSFESNFDRLQRAFQRAMLIHILFATAVIPLLALCMAGLIVFLLLWEKPTLALVWTALISGMMAGAAATALFNRSLRRAVLTDLLGRLLQVQKLRSDRLRQEIWGALESFGHIATAAGWGAKISAPDSTQARVIANVYDLLGLHVESEIAADLPPEDRRGLRDEITRLLKQAEGLISTTEIGDLIGRPHRVRDLLDQSEVALARALANWAPHRPGGWLGAKGEPSRSSPADFLEQELEPALVQRRFSLLNAFAEVQYQPGQDALARLDSQYGRLLAILARRRDSDPLVAAEIPTLAEEAYSQALSVLEDAVDLVQAINAPDRQRLEREAAELEAEIAALPNAGETGDRTALRAERLQARRERLRVMEKQELSIEELLNECERCEACLDRTCIELASLKGESAAIAVTAVTETLRRTVDRARSVQDELKHLTK